MYKKLLLIFLLTVFTHSIAFSQEIPVKVETLVKISTSDVKMQEGDDIIFVVADDVFLNGKLYIKKGTNASGIITSLVNNGFTCQEASIYAENFKVKTVKGVTVKLSGIVYKKGRNHWMLTQFIPTEMTVGNFIRGGEVEIMPQKDVFTLYLGVKADDL